jgi:hypothetical protein
MFWPVYRWALLLPPVVCGSLVLCALSCGSGSDPSLFEPVDAGALVVPTRSGAGGSSIGRGGTGGSGGSSGSSSGGNSGNGTGGGDADAGQAGADAGVDAAAPAPCNVDADCDGSNACATEHCVSGFCSPTFVAQGSVCGGAVSECVDSFSCDGAGRCVPNGKAQGTLCGNAAAGECATHDSCDGAGVCRPNYLPLSTPCGDQSSSACSFPDVCDGLGSCSPNNAAAGVPCGSDAGATECSSGTTCDGQGACSGAHQPNGTVCTGGSCTQGQCIPGQPVGCPGDVANTVPFSISWSSVGRPNLIAMTCQTPTRTPDYALVFTAPQAGTYRFHAAGLIDSTQHENSMADDGDAVMTIARGSCGTQMPSCNDDCNPGDNPDGCGRGTTDPQLTLGAAQYDSQLELSLQLNEVVTVYLNEFGEPDGGTGTLTITRTGP